MSAKESTPDCAELRAMETLRTIDHSTLESDFHISSPLEHFWIDGPNGRHLALVFTLSAINTDCLFRVHGPNRTLIKDLCFQLAKSLELIHSRGLCHGDFRSSNILVRLLPGIDSLPEAELLKAFHNGKCKKPETVRVISAEDDQPVTRASCPSVPEHLVSSVSIGFHSSLCAASLSITDFGVSYPFSDPPVQGCTGIPLAYTSPEERFHQRSLLGPASDIWALGCVILQLAFNVHPFAALNLECGDDDNTIAAKFEEIMGPMPEPYRQVYKEEHREMAKWRCFNEAVAESDKTGEEYITAVEDWKTKQLAERRAKIKAGECQLNLGQEWFRKMLQRTNYMAITSQERDGMIQQYESSRRSQLQKDKKGGKKMVQLPYDEGRKNGKLPDCDDEDNIQLRMDDEEAEKMFDLCMSIFRWMPEDRATIEQVLEHPWFEGRNRDAKKVPKSVAGKKSAVGEAAEGVKARFKSGKAGSILSEAFL